MRRVVPVAAFVSLLAAAVPASARLGMPEPLTERGALIESIYTQIAWAAILVSLFVFALLFYVIYKYRANGGSGRQTHEHERENLKAEMTWTIIPLFIVLWVGVISYNGLVQLDNGYDEDEVDMHVGMLASKWNWRSVYEGGNADGGFEMTSSPSFSNGGEKNFVADENVFYYPADKVIRFHVTSMDILHAFAIFDANDGPVGMVDANPLESYGINELDVVFTEGSYEVKCKEHCFNPGHAYMRARIEAIPQAQYDEWADEMRLRGGAATVTELGLEIDANGNLTATGDLTAVRSSRVIMQVANGFDESATIAIGDLASQAVPSGALVRFAFDVNDAGTFAVTSTTSASSLDLTVLDAVTVDVDLFEWGIDPEQLTLQAGQTYLLNIRNIGQSEHNLYIGDYVDGGDSQIDFASVDIPGGASTSLIVTIPEAGLFDTWCNIPGHADLGMLAEASVA